MFRELIKFSDRLHNKIGARSIVSKLVRLSQHTTYHKNYDLAYFFDKHEILFIGDSNRTKESITIACERNAYKGAWTSSGYTQFVNDLNRTFYPSQIPDYGHFYTKFNEQRLQKEEMERQRRREEERQREEARKRLEEQQRIEQQAKEEEERARFGGAQSDSTATALMATAAGG